MSSSAQAEEGRKEDALLEALLQLPSSESRVRQLLRSGAQVSDDVWERLVKAEYWAAIRVLAKAAAWPSAVEMSRCLHFLWEQSGPPHNKIPHAKMLTTLLDLLSRNGGAYASKVAVAAGGLQEDAERELRRSPGWQAKGSLVQRVADWFEKHCESQPE